MSLLSQASLCVTPNAYSEGKLYSVIPSDGSGDMSVTRATTATRVNSAGLVELVPYNLLTYSEQFDNADWTKLNVSVTANTTTAPNGTLTADTITDTSTFGIIYQNYTNFNTSQIVTFSVYLKKSNNDWVNVTTSRSSSTTYGEFGAWFNLATGAIGSNYTPGAGVLIDKQIESVGNGWYRCSVTGYVPNATAYTPFTFNSNADNSLTSSVGQSHYQWGAQLVEGSVAKDYQKTETRLNIPRLDYSNGTCPSLLVEPQRTNLLDYSSSFNSGFWLLFNATVTGNTTTSPSGVQDADTLISNSTTGGSVYRLVNTSGTQTISCFFKAGTSNVCNIGFSNGWYAEYNLSNQTFTTVGTVTASMEDYGNGWYRCIITANTTSTLIAFGNSGTTGTTVYIWGAQAEIGSYPTSYIPTTSASVTRNADVISKTGISSLIGQTEGVVFAEFTCNSTANTGSYDSIINIATNANNSIDVLKNNTTAELYVFAINGGTIQVNSVGISETNVLGHHKVALAYKANDYALYLDGVQVFADTSATVPACSNLYLGHYFAGTGQLGGGIKAAALWKTRLTNDELERLTGTGFNTYAEMANYYNYITQ